MEIEATKFYQPDDEVMRAIAAKQKLAQWRNERRCQINSNASQNTIITQSYEAQIWNHSVRTALRFCL
jgi:hypothetical protein